MRLNLKNLQPVEPVTDSTESTESREMTEYLQAEVDRYARRIVDLILDDPCISAPKILRRLAIEGQCSSERSVAHLFGGPRIFRQTCHRMGILRQVLVTRLWERMPFQMDIQYREWEGQRQYIRKPDSNDDWVSWWAPDMFSVCPFEPKEEEEAEAGEQRLFRLPAGEGESDYFEEVQEGGMPHGSDVEMVDAE